MSPMGFSECVLCVCHTNITRSRGLRAQLRGWNFDASVVSARWDCLCVCAGQRTRSTPVAHRVRTNSLHTFRFNQSSPFVAGGVIRFSLLNFTIQLKLCVLFASSIRVGANERVVFLFVCACEKANNQIFFVCVQCCNTQLTLVLFVCGTINSYNVSTTR